MRQRAKVVPAATGTVLEIGFGSGLNLELYDPDRVDRILALEPSAAMWRLARAGAGAFPRPIEHLQAGAEEMPIDSGSVDTAVVTYTLCTIPDLAAALREVARVLKPAGRLLFCEHGAAPDARTRRWQDRLDRIWGRLGGGCHLNREIPALVERGGFEVTELESRYLPGWKPASFNYWGSAVPAVGDPGA